MAYDEKLAARVRAALSHEPIVDEIKMFGGICFKVDGYMACGVLDDGFIVKCDPAEYEGLLAKPNTKPFDFTGKPMRGILVVKPAGVRTAATLKSWVIKGVATAKAKAAAPAPKTRRKAQKAKWPAKTRRPRR